MGNAQPRLKLHYVTEKDHTVSGLIQILDLPKGTSIPDIDVYIIGREKISWVSGQNWMTLKDSHTIFKEKVTIKASDNEPTFSIKIPQDAAPSGHGGNYGGGVGYAVGYHVYAEAHGNTDISDTAELPVSLGPLPSAPSGTDAGSIKFAGRTLEYELPTGMPRATNQTLKLRMNEGENQRVRIRLREEGKQLKGQEQTSSEIKYELEDVAIGTEWTPVSILISKYANTAREGTVLKISHVLEVTAIGTQAAYFVNIPLTLA